MAWTICALTPDRKALFRFDGGRGLKSIKAGLSSCLEDDSVCSPRSSPETRRRGSRTILSGGGGKARVRCLTHGTQSAGPGPSSP
jgi:hypothetical protein